MTNPVPLPVSTCGDPVRLFLYERVTKYFDPFVEEKTETGTCAICGIVTTGAANKTGPVCYAQRSITKKRRRAAVGEPVAFGSPLHKTSMRNDLNGIGVVMLVEEDRSHVIANVIPVMPLPSNMTAVAGVQGGQREFYSRFLLDPPKPPFLFVVWQRAAAIPLVMTYSMSRMVVCGEANPVIVDFRVVLECVETTKEIGLAAFKEACRVRQMLQQSSTDAAREDAIDALEKLRETVPFDMDRLTRFPLPTSSEYEFLFKVLETDDPDAKVDIAA